MRRAILFFTVGFLAAVAIAVVVLLVLSGANGGRYDIHMAVPSPDGMKEGMRLGRRPELVGGGLIRSMGGWSGVMASRKRGEKTASDERILGDGEFVEKVLEEWDEIGRANLRLGGVRKSLLLLAQQVCENWGVTIEELKSGSRRRVVLEAREEFSQAAVKGLGYSGAEVARYLGVTGSCVTRIVAEGQLTEEVRLRYLNLQARPARTSP